MASSVANAINNLDDVDFTCSIIKTPQSGSVLYDTTYPEWSTFHFRNHRSYIYLSHPEYYGQVQDLNEYQMVPSHEPVIRGGGCNLWIPCFHKYAEETFPIHLYKQDMEGLDKFPGFIVTTFQKSSIKSLQALINSHLKAKKEKFTNFSLTTNDSVDSTLPCDYVSLGGDKYADSKPPPPTSNEHQFQAAVTKYLEEQQQIVTCIDEGMMKYQERTNEFLTAQRTAKNQESDLSNALQDLKRRTDNHHIFALNKEKQNRQVFADFDTKFKTAMNDYAKMLEDLSNAKLVTAEAIKPLPLGSSYSFDEEIKHLQDLLATAKANKAKADELDAEKAAAEVLTPPVASKTN